MNKATRRCRTCDKTKPIQAYSRHMRTCKKCIKKREQKTGSIKSRLRDWIKLVNWSAPNGR